MSRLRNISQTFLRPFQTPSPDQQHARSVSQPLSLQTPDSPTEPRRDKTQPSPTLRESGFITPLRTPTRQGDYPSSSSRPTSTVYGTPGETMARGDTEELLPVFTFMSSHSNKLYQEGYFLKLNDLDTNGKPNADRNWTECFAQLVGTVLSLWDAGALDAAGQDGEVAPTFINLADASIKMIAKLPTRNEEIQPLQNVLSISTAGKNRYLLHFNSLHSLTQWTASIRLAMFEHSSLQELYTGSLIAGRGRHLNNIKSIMERSKFAHEDWARVRFGAGTPWRRCWCVIEPPNAKEFTKAQKSLKKARNPYDRTRPPKGCIKFYDTKKTKKTLPIATVSEGYSGYAIYPQSKPLIEQSTLVKIEGKITIHSNPESRTEGFVFVMPEVHPAVSGFEIMLRFIFAVFDTFYLYGRPDRLIPERTAVNSLMFAMPQERRYGYLDIIDVASLIHSDGSDQWSERDWRKRLKEATLARMEMTGGGRTSSTLGNRRPPSTSFGSRNGVRYDDGASLRSHPSQRQQYNQSTDAVFATTPQRMSAMVSAPNSLPAQNYHARSVSESVVLTSPTKTRRQEQEYGASRMSVDRNDSTEATAPRSQHLGDQSNGAMMVDSKNSSDSELGRVRTNPDDVRRDVREQAPPAPVAAPPQFAHQPGDRPQVRPQDRPDLRREKSRMSNATLSQLVDASKNPATGTAAAGALIAWKSKDSGSMPPTDRTTAGAALGVNSEQYDGPNDQRSRSAHSVNRKPLPRSSSGRSGNRRPSTGHGQPPVPMHNESHLGLASDASMLGVPAMQRQTSGNSDSNSNYEGGDEAERNPFSDAHRVDQHRNGGMNTASDPRYGSTPRSDMPNVNYGPTKSLTSNVSRPSTAGRQPSAERKAYVNRAVTLENRDDQRAQSLSSASWRPGSSRQEQPGFGQSTEVPNGYAPYRPQPGERQPSIPRQPQNSASQRPAHHAAQLAFNNSAQQGPKQTPVQYHEDTNYYAGAQQQSYPQQSVSHTPVDPRSNGQWANPQVQQQPYYGGTPGQQQAPAPPQHQQQQYQQQQQMPRNNNQQQTPSQQWQQQGGYYGAPGSNNR